MDEAENPWYSENTWEGTPIISSENFLLFSTMPPNRFFVRNFEGSNNQCFECGLGSMLGGYQLVPQKYIGSSFVALCIIGIYIFVLLLNFIYPISADSFYQSFNW